MSQNVNSERLQEIAQVTVIQNKNKLVMTYKIISIQIKIITHLDYQSIVLDIDNLEIQYFFEREHCLEKLVSWNSHSKREFCNIYIKVKWALESITTNKVEVMEFQLSYFKSWKMMLWKCCTQYASKFGKLSSGHRTGKGQFSLQPQRQAMPKNVQTTTQWYSSHMLVK